MRFVRLSELQTDEAQVGVSGTPFDPAGNNVRVVHQEAGRGWRPGQGVDTMQNKIIVLENQIFKTKEQYNKAVFTAREAKRRWRKGNHTINQTGRRNASRSFFVFFMLLTTYPSYPNSTAEIFLSSRAVYHVSSISVSSLPPTCAVLFGAK